jgi:thiamine biosynthesis protein ThiI
VERALFLVKLGELVLKGGNQESFMSILRRNLDTMLRSRVEGAKVWSNPGRIYVSCPPSGAENVASVLEKLAGISGWAQARITEKTEEAVLAACVEEAKNLAGRGLVTFKIEARRTDKSFPLDSCGICRAAGDAVLRSVPGMAVQVRSPQGTINVEIREKAYVYGPGKKGLRGLPAGSAGRGLLLLSGGIDSPVAGIMMAVRGMGLDAVYFHTPPYTSPEAAEKTARLAEIAGSYAMGIRLVTVNFTEVQKRIRDRAPSPWNTVLLRMAMMEAASLLARKLGAKCLVTGESLSQVASQTVENLACSESRAALPVLRPLIGMDKESIIEQARRLGTYETSILPYADCCVLFSPPHPVLHGAVSEAEERYAALESGALIEEALRTSGTRKCGYYTCEGSPRMAV